MNLLIDCHVFDGKYQGTRTYLQGIYQNMVKYKDIEFYFAAQDISNLKKYFGEDNNVHYIKFNTSSSIIRLVYEIPKIIKKYHIDYAHFQYVSPFVKTCKEIVTIHDLLFLDFPQYFSKIYRLKNNILFKRSAKRADMLLTVSEYSKSELINNFGILSSRILVTPNAVLPIGRDFKKIDIKAKYGLDKFILTVSRIEPRKNHLMLLKAFVDLNLPQKGYKLMMVGTPDLTYKDFMDYYKKLDPSVKNTIIMQSVCFSDLVALYQEADLFVFPSLAEGFGIPPLESLQYGCPLLCSNTTAMLEFNLPNDWTFNPNDEDELKEKILKLLSVRPEIEGVRRILNLKYNWEKISADLYREIISKLQK